MTATGGNLGAVEPFLGAAERAAAGAARGAVRADSLAGRQHAGQRPRADRAPSQLSRPASRRRREHGRVRATGPGRARRRRAAGGIPRPVEPGRRRVAPAGSRRPSAPSRPASTRGERLASARWRRTAGISSARFSRAEGRLDAAARTCLQAMEFAALARPPAPPTAGPAYVGLAEVAYQRNGSTPRYGR